MKIHTGLKLSQTEVLSLLEHFDDSSDEPLHESLDFYQYSKKLSQYAYFVIATEDKQQIGFIAYYLNDENHFAYIPQVVVHKSARHKGVGHSMFTVLYECIRNNFLTLKLEVLKSNINARAFYEREGFVESEDRYERLLLYKILNK